MRPVLIVLLAVVSSALEENLISLLPPKAPGSISVLPSHSKNHDDAVCCLSEETIKSLVFPAETSNSYVELVPLKPLGVNAFTLCMRVATELKGQREIILFAYRIQANDALNVWREKDGRYVSRNSLFKSDLQNKLI